MNEIVRNTELHTYETLLMMLGLIFITAAKLIDEHRFNSFMILFVNNRYFKIYKKEGNQTQSRFNLLLFATQMISYGLAIQLCIKYFDIALSQNILVIIAFLALFIVFKYYLEKIIAAIFDIPEFAEDFQFNKLTYHNLSALILIPFIAFFIYTDYFKNILIYTILGLFIFLNLISLILTLRNHQKLISKYLFYFILYLCALEIAPYLIVIRLFFTDKA
ncbi:DUF4271 domain-containing protein [Robertkochia solimangrovi]|uniref:DUF4271 domain-containing protein n=1 Tax=Robertkochia solimangrovi TaxID=2213046 RepID=UPI00117CA0C5|nr:DUF4271 domain-containing protein [Robertkochia solimangrovi]TRZ46292.1 DUF4271 domain-containing protein [Robertkochia solimangrovi]